MNNLQVSYITRGGKEFVIKLPLNELGRVLSEDYLSDSERRRLAALQMQAESGERVASLISMH